MAPAKPASADERGQRKRSFIGSSWQLLDPVFPALLEQRLAIDAEDLGRARVVVVRLQEHFAHVVFFEALERPLIVDSSAHELLRAADLLDGKSGGTNRIAVFEQCCALEHIAQ